MESGQSSTETMAKFVYSVSFPDELRFGSVQLPQVANGVKAQMVIKILLASDERSYCYDVDIGLAVTVRCYHLEHGKLVHQGNDTLLVLRKRFIARAVRDQLCYPDFIQVQGEKYWVREVECDDHYCYALRSQTSFKRLSAPFVRHVHFRDDSANLVKINSMNILLLQSVADADEGQLIAVDFPSNIDDCFLGDHAPLPSEGEAYYGYRLRAKPALSATEADYTYEECEPVLVKTVLRRHAALWATVKANGTDGHQQNLDLPKITDQLMTELTYIKRVRRSFNAAPGGWGRFLGPDDVVLSQPYIFIITPRPRFGSLHDYAVRAAVVPGIQHRYTDVEAQHIMRHLLPALAHLHDEGLAHGNLRSEIIALLAEHEELKGLDLHQPLMESKFVMLEVALSGLDRMVSHDPQPANSNATEETVAQHVSAPSGTTPTHVRSDTNYGDCISTSSAHNIDNMSPVAVTALSPGPAPHRRYQLRPVPAERIGDRVNRPHDVYPAIHAALTARGIACAPLGRYCGMCVDCYQAGVLLLYLLTGQPPFTSAESELEWHTALYRAEERRRLVAEIGEELVCRYADKEIQQCPLQRHLVNMVGEPRVQELEASGALDLLQGLLRFFPSGRLTARAAMDMPWMRRNLRM